MSELSELIEINKNIERQNEEIIRLLKKIAGEQDELEAKKERLMSLAPDFGDLFSSNQEVVQEDEPLDESLRIGSLLDTEIDVGEVYYIEGLDIYKLTIENNEKTIDNLTGDGESSEFALQELIANESIKNNASLENGTVILSKVQCENLPEVMKVCVEQGAQKVYMPLSASAQLVGAPHNLINYVRMDFYKSDDHLIEKLF